MRDFKKNKIYLLFLSSLILIFIHLGCQFSSNESDLRAANKLLGLENELLRKQKTIDSLSKLIHADVKPKINSLVKNGSRFVNSSSARKYIYIIVYSKEPKIKTTEELQERSFLTDVHGMPRLYVTKNSVVYERYTYKSKIFEVQNYTLDDKFQKIEEVKANVRLDWSLSPIYHPEFGTLERVIISAEAKVFDTYREASISKSQL